jgi:hypothetical protein
MNKEKIFPVIETCKYDMKAEFEASEKIRLEIEQFTDEQMTNIAAEIGDMLSEDYWCAIRKVVEKELMKR